MGAKIKQAAPIAKMWIWLKPIKSKSMENFRSEFGIEKAREFSNRWIKSSGIDSDGDFRDVVGLPGASIIYKKEVAYVHESVECPKGSPAKPAPKAKWAKIPLDTNIAKSGLIDIANQLGAENARLKNQITKLKGAKA